MIFGIYDGYPVWGLHISWIPRFFRSRTQVVLPHELLACIHHLLPQCFLVGKIFPLWPIPLAVLCYYTALQDDIHSASKDTPGLPALSLTFLQPSLHDELLTQRPSLTCKNVWTGRATSRDTSRLLSICLAARHWSHLSLSASLHHPPHFCAASLCVVRRQQYLAHSNAGSRAELKSKHPSGEHL
jgi:hypothetical protein